MSKSITYAQVIEAAIDQHPSAAMSSQKSFRSCCKRWCSAHGASLDDPASSTLGDEFDMRMQQFISQLNHESPGNARAAKNVRTAASRLREAYLSLLASQDLPADFNAAFRQCMDAQDLKPADLNRLLKQKYHSDDPGWYGAQIWYFYAGTARPGKSWRGDSRRMLIQCEEVFGLAPGALVSRAYPQKSPILIRQHAPITYRVARSSQADAPYALRDLPPPLKKIWTLFADWRTKPTVLVNGEVRIAARASIWASPESPKKHWRSVLRFFGWLCLPTLDVDIADAKDEECWRTGKGLTQSDLLMAQLFDTALLWEYIEFARRRQHNQQLTTAHLDLAMLANSFASTPHCFLLGHPELAVSFGLPAPTSFPEWEVTVDGVHQQTLRLIRGLRKLAVKGQRSPDEPLRHVLDSESPYKLFLELARRMEREEEPLRANFQSWAVWARDLAVFKMLMEVPLRSKNVISLRIGEHLTRSVPTGIWHVEIKKGDLKNHYSGDAQDISRDYSEETSRAIDRYVDGSRPSMVGHGMTNVFLLGPAAGRRAHVQLAAKSDFKLSPDSLYHLIGKRLKQYFGETQGSNIFRHLIATSILKEDPTKVEVAAAILNNSPNSIRANYRHLTQEDGLRLGRQWFSKQTGKDSS